jgi:signal transduction histidine kinase
MLRSDTADRSAPLPGAADIPALVDSFRRAGADVRLDVVGHPERLSASRGLTAYRIVQEALTNSTKHAIGQPVTVRIQVGDREATVRVHNELPAPAIGVGSTTAGAGLLGMQERAQGVGGRVAAGPDRTGWLVEAVLPT